MTVCHSSTDNLQDPDIGKDSFKYSPKMYLSLTYWCIYYMDMDLEAYAESTMD